MNKKEQEAYINELLVGLFNNILKIEEQVLYLSSNHNLTISEVHTISAIAEGPDPMMGELAQRLNVTIATVTVAINKLVEKGYVERHRSEDDRRIVVISLTDKGREVVEEHDLFHKLMIQSAIKDMSPNQLTILTTALLQLDEFFSSAV